MSGFEAGARLVYLAAAVCLVAGLHLMKSPRTAWRGDLLSALGMAAAVAATLFSIIHDGPAGATGWIVLFAGRSRHLPDVRSECGSGGVPPEPPAVSVTSSGRP